VLVGCVAACSGHAADGFVRVGQLALAGGLLAPALGGLAVMALPRRSLRGPQVAAAAAWTAAGLAMVAAIGVGVHGPVLLAFGRSDTQPVLGLVADRLTVTLLVTVFGIGAVVQSFSLRYLRADDRRRVFFAGASMLLAAMGVVAASATVAGVVVGWVLAGAAFVVIVGYRPDLPGVAATVARTRRAFLIGDVALIGALAVVILQAGNVELAGSSGVAEAAAHLGSLRLVVALAVVVAALTRCAQGPLGGWLPGTVAAPTPVSALLHAGFVNGGGILLIRLGALSSDSAVAMGLAFAVAGLSAIGATAVMARRADVKTDLAYSTMGQMGFMVAECAVGACGAAVVHLVGHAFYKATLFLGSGGGVRRPGRVGPGPDTGFSAVRAAVAAGAGLAAAGVVALVPGALGHRGTGPLLVFVAASAGLAAWSWWTPRSILMSGWVAALLVGSALYGLVAGALASWVQPALPSVGAGVLDPWLLGTVAAGGLLLTLLARAPRIGPWLAVVLIHVGSPDSGAEIRLAPRTPRLASWTEGRFSVGAAAAGESAA
jgi:NAD(P)H-quinone oxidoreductase subunit 5